MTDLLDSLTSDSLVMICLVLGVIALCLAIGISVEIYTSNKKYKEMHKDELEEENTQTRLNIKESADVKYVEEDRELEKTKAKMELEQLREKLKREEEEKQKVIEQNLALEQEKKKQQEKIEVLEDTIVDLKPIKNEEKEQELRNAIESTKLEDTITKLENTLELERTKEIAIPAIKEIESLQDEEEAIISYEELKNAKNFGYTDEEMYNNVDEKDAIISVHELEKLYSESNSISTTPVEENKIDSNVRPSSYDSPVYSYSKTDQDLILEQTANLEKLNEEIRKTNEFLKMLKDLKKNLD